MSDASNAVQADVVLVTEFCERGDLYHAIAEQAGNHLEGIFCWQQRYEVLSE